MILPYFQLWKQKLKITIKRYPFLKFRMAHATSCYKSQTQTKKARKVIGKKVRTQHIFRKSISFRHSSHKFPRHIAINSETPRRKPNARASGEIFGTQPLASAARAPITEQLHQALPGIGHVTASSGAEGSKFARNA